MESHAMLAVNHIIDALSPMALQQCIKCDLELRFVSRKGNWHGVLKHVSSRAEQLDVLDDGIVTGPSVKNNLPAGNNTSNNRSVRQHKGTHATWLKSNDKNKDLPECLNPASDGKHMLKNCPNTSLELKKLLFNQLVLIGSPLLNSLGIDAPTHLAVVCQTFQDMDYSAVPSALAGGKRSRQLKQRAEFTLAPPVGDSSAVHSEMSGRA
jgi:hypothetical protein